MAAESKRLNLLLTSAQDSILQSAAKTHGESIGDYILRNALMAAEMDLADRSVFVVDDSTWNMFKSLVDAPSLLPEAMSKLVP